MISICMVTYNGEKFINKQLDSILSQMDCNDELIVSDDSSTDKTIAIIKSYNDKRIKILENQKFQSPVFNFENALKYADGEYIFLADQDDIWLPGKVKKIKKYLRKYDLVLSDANIVDADGEIIGHSFYKINNSRSGFINNMIKNSYLGCTMAFNRKILKKSLPFPGDLPMHDWWIGLVGEIYGKTHFIDEPLISYRRHNDNASPTSEKSQYSFKKKIHFRIILIKNLIMSSFLRLFQI
ncbi:MAG: glycosyltransferase family 2 protein [gamma proteobacterium symbiont of Lucinoma myriamae]|nr:glycosyltransferase family 2 protein [gamma proteobacterium symbiont of Lucinoma myriamae]MCU7818069.1 glycosyltransferase family 2 protein [gamma proteobacterium symbiont of Lucinoma myriamae]MCU7832470.1 glycosyltransferase family 2 protein [gamma proteobacterium symbiont of Lucinoma myriamae]